MLDPFFEEQLLLTNIQEAHPIYAYITAAAKQYGFVIANISDLHNTAHVSKAILVPPTTEEEFFSVISVQKEIDTILYIKKEQKLQTKIKQQIETYLSAKEKSFSIQSSGSGYEYKTHGSIKINPYKGLFIAVDHPDGAGASTLVKNIMTFLEEENISSFSTEEPTNEMFGGIIRTALRGHINLQPDTMQLIYTADRIEHTKVFYPALKRGDIVVSSRYSLSTLAFSYKTLPLQPFLTANAQVYWPDINFLICDGTITEHLRRIDTRLEGRELFDTEDMLQKVDESLTVMHQLFPQTTYLLDAKQSREDIKKAAIEIIKRHPKYKKS